MQPLYEYVCHMKGHRNSKGELAEWVIKSHETGKILSSHKSEKKAKEHLQQMHIFNESADGGQGEDFHTLITRYATATEALINKFLEKYELSIEVVDTEEGKDFFEETGAIAVRLASLQDDVHVAPVAINEALISRYYYDEWDEDNAILNECVSDTLWHEACHHICLYISDLLDVDIMDTDSEEDTVENYALYMTSKTMGIHKEFSTELVDKFNGVFAILDAINNGEFDKESLKEMMKFLYPSVDSENDLVDILEGIGLTESDSKSDSKSDKLFGESTDGTDMDKRVKIFMEGVSQLGLSKNQVDAIGKITNVCVEGVVGNGELNRDEQAYERILQCLHEMDIPDETIEIATHILGDSKETLIKIGNAIATMINNGDRSYREDICFNYDRKTGKVKFCMEGVGRRPQFYIEDRATATNPDTNYRIMYRELVEKGFSRDTLSILTTILGATVDTLKKIVQAKHELEERDNMRIPAEAFRDWDNGHGDEEIGSMDAGGDVGPDSDLGEIDKISERDEETPNF